MPSSWRILLLPFSWLYCLVVTTRNWLYDIGVLKSQTFDLPVISVGNLTVGGTGKTPLTEYLIRLLSPSHNCALLSRGYRRKTRGVVMAGPDATAATIGDEPMQMKQKFTHLLVVVAEKRVEGMKQLLGSGISPQVVLLDDAFQHRSLTPGLSIVVMDYHRPVYLDRCLPAGNLREPARNASRADIIIVNKCPHNLSESERDAIVEKLNPLPKQQIYFSRVGYQPPRRVVSQKSGLFTNEVMYPENTPVLAVAGIGHPKPFFDEIKRRFARVITMPFGDHHDFTLPDLLKIEKTLKTMGAGALLMTTEKDAVRLREMALKQEIIEKSWYLPIELKILFNQQEPFNKIINSYVTKNQ